MPAATGSASRCATRTTSSCSPTPTSTPCTSTRRSRITRRSRSPRSRPASTWPARCPPRPRSTSAGRSSKTSRRSGKVYMMMETVVYSREYLFVKELYDRGELGPDPVPAWKPPAGHGGLAWLLGRLSADALRHALRQPVPRAPGQARRARRLPRVRTHRRGADSEVRQPVCHRDGDVQAARLGCLRRGHAEPVQHRAAVPRELRRVRIEAVVRVAAGGGRGAGGPHEEHPRTTAR